MSNLYGVDIIRAYEVLWRNSLGKPEVALLEIFEDPIKPNTDTWKLKQFLESISDKTYSEFKSLRSEIHAFLKGNPNFGDNYIKVISQQDFYDIDFNKTVTPQEFPHKIIQGLRFICQHTDQPFIGSATLYLRQPQKDVDAQLVKTLQELRNTKHTMRSFTDELFVKHFNQSIDDDFVLSISLNRRGGISFQAVRCRKSIDFLEYIQRSATE